MATNEELKASLVDIVSEAWRLNRVFEKVLAKMSPSDQAKYSSQFTWFLRKVQDAVQVSNINVVSCEGALYDIGMNIDPMNIDDFDAEDQLYVKKMLEPIIIDAETGSVLKTGTVLLERCGK